MGIITATRNELRKSCSLCLIYNYSNKPLGSPLNFKSSSHRQTSCEYLPSDILDLLLYCTLVHMYLLSFAFLRPSFEPYLVSSYNILSNFNLACIYVSAFRLMNTCTCRKLWSGVHSTQWTRLIIQWYTILYTVRVISRWVRVISRWCEIVLGSGRAIQ